MRSSSSKKIAQTVVKPFISAVKFDTPIEEAPHARFSSMDLKNNVPTQLRKVAGIAKTPLELKGLPKLQESVLSGAEFSNLVRSIAIWDARCVYTFTYHSLKQKIEDHFNGLESWLLLSLLNARFDAKKFTNVLQNMINLREELYTQKKFNAAVVTSAILLSDNLLKVMSESDRALVALANDTFKQREDHINFEDHRALFISLRPTIAHHNMTMPLVVLNQTLEQEGDKLKTQSSSEPSEQERRVKLALALIKLIKEKLKRDAQVKDTISQALWDMSRVTIDDLDKQIHIEFKKNDEGKIAGSVRTWEKNDDYVKAIPSVVAIPVLAPAPTTTPVPAQALSSVKGKIKLFQAAINNNEEQEKLSKPQPKLTVRTASVVTKWQPAKKFGADESKAKPSVSSPKIGKK